MKNKYDLSRVESEVMHIVWSNEEILTTRALLEKYNEKGNTWKRQTMNTIIVRLEVKGLIKREGKKVYPLYTEKEYVQIHSQELLNVLYNGKISNFVVALSGGKEISTKDQEELNNLIDRMGNGE